VDISFGVCCGASHDQAGAAADGNYAGVKGLYTANPQLTAGAGNNFNAGFCVGLVLELSLEESLLLGKVTFFLRAKCP